ncbi:MAG: ABC-F family ATP-binding cassette domain-containing protein, partial [Anaerolinea sp.]|nr:ABC-F family ATP-binding cassette domain-containing protein [Anaerolinea sp.]
ALAGANFLLLDEPTNHLDIASQEILQNVLADFSGTILLVSHDRYLIDALATQIWTLTPGKLDVFEGSYAEYLAAREKARLAEAAKAESARAAAKPTVNGIKAGEKKFGLNPYQLQKRIEELEALIPELEARLDDITEEIGSASANGDAGRVAELGRAYTQAEADLHAAMEDWERLVS